MKQKFPSTRGVALIIILGLLVVILGLAVTFLNRTRIERNASSSYAATSSTRQFADIAVNFVQSQVQQAASQGSEVAWVSQPGMVRTFSNASGGPLLKAYKLFSADNLILNSPTAATLANEFTIPTTWAADKAVWTDLNSPVTVGSGAGTRTLYPILSPEAEGKVEGFTLAAPPGTSSTKGQMPVKWLYVLQDGKLVAPTGTGNQANVAGDVAPSGSDPGNPIVGRVAFWTDDETCKVNINTASEGTYWDTPRVDTNQDREYAKYQPAQKEFQRYPGHPAMTSLAPIFFATSATSTPVLTSAQREAIYSMTPRVSGGGSLGGTAIASSAIAPLAPRLYASVDELIFSPSRTSQIAATGVTRDTLERSRFFLTANSRAPETTLFNTPRICLWPIDNTESFRTPFDRLIAHCSTINGSPYYFTRSDPQSPSSDFPGLPTASSQTGLGRNRNLYYYLQSLTSQNIPGFGGNFATKFGTADRDLLLTEIFDYVRSVNLDDSGLPDVNRFGTRGRINSAASTYSPGARQVTPIRIGATQGFGRFPIITELGIHFICTADGKKPDGTLGGVDEGNVADNKTLGSPATLLTTNQRRIEAMFFFETFIPSISNPLMYPSYSVRIQGLDAFKIRGTSEATDISLHFPGDATKLSFYNSQASAHGRDYGGSDSHRNALCLETRLPLRGGMSADAGSYPKSLYPFISVPVTIDTTAGTMTFTGGLLTLEIFPRSLDTSPGYPAGTQPVQTISVDFKGGTFPLPSLPSTGTPAGASASTPATAKENWWTFSRDGAMPGKSGRLFFWGKNPSDGAVPLKPLAGAPFRYEDVVRTMVPDTADYRLLSLNLPSSATPTFIKHPKYDDTTVHLAHSVAEIIRCDAILRQSNLAPLAAGAPWNQFRQPDVTTLDLNSASGDWDNGMGLYVDGAYINRPDEGNIFGLGSGTIPFFDNDTAYANVGPTFFSPNRQMPSVGMLGSLPTGANAGVPFRTLLFRPQAGHLGATDPKDHLLTDLFWMPVVEPYAISEPFSTAGKINLNYEIIPFRDFVKRSTGMVSLLRSEKILAIPTAKGGSYKSGGVASQSNIYRFPLDIHATLGQWDSVFSSETVFKSPSQIMEVHLVPEGSTLAEMSTFWTTNSLTGDNSRERPYTNLLGRLTTKSNTYTVHYRAQGLKKSPGSVNGVWTETKDKVLGEHRGSTTIERYINPNDPSLIDYATQAYPLVSGQDLGAKYKWRMHSVNAFAP